MWRNNMQAIAQIGAMTRPQVRNMPTLDLNSAIGSYYDAKDAATKRAEAEAEKQRRQAYVEELTAQHPEAAAQIAADPAAYMKMLNDKEAAERDQQFKMDYLNKQFNNSLALADRQHANSVGLARMRADLENQAAAQARAERAAQQDEALNNRTITPEEYNLIKRRELLGDIVNDGGVAPDGVALTGNKEYDKIIAKDAAQKAIKYQGARDELKAFNDLADRVKELLPQAYLNSWVKRKTPTWWLNDNAQQARAEIRNIMGGLRLDQMQYMKGAISDKEQQFLSDVVSGDISKYTPAEITGALNSIQRKMNAETNKYAPPIRDVVGKITTSTRKINQSGKDWSKVSNEDILKGL